MSSLDILKVILGVFFLVVCVAVIVIILMQRTKEAGLGGAITGQTTESFYSKTKGGMSKEKFLMQLTIVLSVCFAVVAVVLSALLSA